jgi:hypothetical protein
LFFAVALVPDVPAPVSANQARQQEAEQQHQQQTQRMEQNHTEQQQKLQSRAPAPKRDESKPR